MIRCYSGPDMAVSTKATKSLPGFQTSTPRAIMP